MPFNASNVTLAVIAGGSGSRMGVAKARLNVEHQSILAWRMQKLEWPGPTMLITSPSTRNPPDAQLFDQECIDPEDGAGPLRGILTALEQSTTPLIATVAVDMPFVRRFMLEWLVEQIQRQRACNGIMFRRPGGVQHWIEPFPSVFRQSAAPIIFPLLAEGKRSVRALCDFADFQAIDVPDNWPADVWTNLNEPDQLKSFLDSCVLRGKTITERRERPLLGLATELQNSTRYLQKLGRRAKEKTKFLG